MSATETPRRRWRRTATAMVVVCTAAIGAAIAVMRTTTATVDPACTHDDAACSAATIHSLLASGQIVAAVDALVRSPIDAVGCHDLAHDVGRAAGSAQQGAALALNSAALDLRCDYGYIHGVFQGFADAGDDIAGAARSGCAADGSESGEECFHAAGHGIAISSSTVDTALDTCAVLDSGAASCAGGVFMEHATSYIAATRGTGGGNRYVEPLDHAAADRLCEAVAAQWILPCARKAALFWAATTPGRDALAQRCLHLAAALPVRDGDVVLECGAGIGEVLRNIEGWIVPSSAAEAAVVDSEVAQACGSLPDVGQLRRGCIEGVVTLILPGQVLSQATRSAWIAPCGAPLDLPTAAACRVLVDAIVTQLDAHG